MGHGGDFNCAHFALVPSSTKEVLHQYLAFTDIVTSITQPYEESWGWTGIWRGWVRRHRKEGIWIQDADAVSDTSRQVGSDGAGWKLL